MTLDEAIKILNERSHRNCSEWWLEEYANGTSFVCGKDRYDWLEAFEAIAVAEKYLRESEPSASDLYFSTPATHTIETLESWHSPEEAVHARVLRRTLSVDSCGGKHA